MRTTVTVDPDVEQLLRAAMQQSGESFKATLNQAIRKGLANVVAVAGEPPFVVEPKNLGLRPGIDPTQLQNVADDLEVDAYLEVARRRQARRSQPTS
jgi:hypothetical protein